MTRTRRKANSIAVPEFQLAVFQRGAIRESTGAVLARAGARGAGGARILFAIGTDFLRAFLPGDHQQSVIAQIGALDCMVQRRRLIDQNM